MDTTFVQSGTTITIGHALERINAARNAADYDERRQYRGSVWEYPDGRCDWGWGGAADDGKNASFDIMVSGCGRVYLDFWSRILPIENADQFEQHGVVDERADADAAVEQAKAATPESSRHLYRRTVRYFGNGVYYWAWRLL